MSATGISVSPDEVDCAFGMSTAMNPGTSPGYVSAGYPVYPQGSWPGIPQNFHFQQMPRSLAPNAFARTNPAVYQTLPMGQYNMVANKLSNGHQVPRRSLTMPSVPHQKQLSQPARPTPVQMAATNPQASVDFNTDPSMGPLTMAPPVRRPNSPRSPRANKTGSEAIIEQVALDLVGPDALKNLPDLPDDSLQNTMIQAVIRCVAKDTLAKKKNSRTEIPRERTLKSIDILIDLSKDPVETRELKAHKRLLRNRQAALDSRARKKAYAESLARDNKEFGDKMAQRDEEIRLLREENEVLQRKALELEALISGNNVSYAAPALALLSPPPHSVPSSSSTASPPQKSGRLFGDSAAYTQQAADLLNDDERWRVPVDANSNLFFSLFLVGAFVAGSGLPTVIPGLPSLPSNLQVAAKTVLGSLMRESNVPTGPDDLPIVLFDEAGRPMPYSDEQKFPSAGDKMDAMSQLYTTVGDMLHVNTKQEDWSGSDLANQDAPMTFSDGYVETSSEMSVFGNNQDLVTFNNNSTTLAGTESPYLGTGGYTNSQLFSSLNNPTMTGMTSAPGKANRVYQAVLNAPVAPAVVRDFMMVVALALREWRGLGTDTMA